MERFNKQTDNSLKELVEQQRIEDNMFESFDGAAAFFNHAGFIIDKESETDFSKLSSLKYLIGNATEEQLKTMQAHPKVQTSWRLKI